MNPKEVNELIDDLLEGGISEADLLRLEAEMSIDPAARRAYLDRVALSLTLVEEAKLLPQPQATSQPRRANAWLSCRPLTVAAAGIVFGMFCTAVALGYVMPRIEKAVLLLHESFENAAVPHGAGFPNATGVWGGDEVRVVAGDGAVKVKDGTRMLRLEPATSDLWNRQFFMIDLTKLPAARDGGSRVVRVAASFHASASEIRDRYLARAAAFAEGPEAIRPEWMTTLWGSEENRALTMAAKAQTFMPGTQGWQTLQLTLDVPPGSRVLVLSFWAATMHGKAEMRAAHFLDDVRVSLETLPSTP